MIAITEIAAALDWTAQENPVWHCMILVPYEKNTVLFEMNAIFIQNIHFNSF